jgi:hypothetical protein
MPVATQEQMTAFAAIPAQIAEETQGLTAAQLTYKPNNDEWCIHEVLVHLADSEIVGSWRLRKTLTEENPTIESYEEATWATILKYDQQDCTQALELFALLRATNASLLDLVAADAWERTAIHQDRGSLTLYDLFITYLEHAQTHLQQIRTLKKAMKI